MAGNLDPRVDYVFKRLFGDEDQAPLLVSLLNAVLRFPATRRVRGVTLLNPFMAQDYAEGKTPILDIRARDDPGRQFLVEMQRLKKAGFAKRLLYYWATGHLEQLLRGERYEMLQPTYLICFLDVALFTDDAYHHTFRAYDQANGVVLCKDLEIHLVELRKFDVPVEEVKTALEQWCFFLKNGALLDLARLPATLNDPAVCQAAEVLMKISQDEIERHRAASRRMVERDAADLVAEAQAMREEARVAQEELRLGREELRLGREELRLGREELLLAQEQAQANLQKGQRIGRIQLLQQLLAQPETSREELARLAEPELAQLEELLKRQLPPPKATNGTPATEPK
jgi:predicted transposase/invertase (TIGR01784 family)